MKTRNIAVIVDDIYDIAEKNLDENDDKWSLVLGLRSLLTSLQYAAPEHVNSGHYFQRLGFYLNKYIDKNDYENVEWCKEIIDIYQDPNYKL